MIDNYLKEGRESTRSSFFDGCAQKMLFLLIGGGIGATVALLFAPKSGTELRGDIADTAIKSYGESLEAGSNYSNVRPNVIGLLKKDVVKFWRT